ncbi:MAG TPA: DoxX family protein [Candidatus Binatia bacterium]|jgi:thiosulfate dehydrogenase [quinone] large subunit
MTTETRQTVVFEEPPLARFLFGDTRLGWLWLPLRLFLGWEWLEAGLHKYHDPAWFETGTALQKFWERALQMSPKPVIAVDWYRSFIQYMLDSGAYTWFSKVVVLSELVIGVALVLGAFTAVAAFFGGFMNWNFIMAGSASTNGLLFAVATWIVLAWRTAGWIGLDRWLLSAVGTPWRPGRFFVKKENAIEA